MKKIILAVVLGIGLLLSGCSETDNLKENTEEKLSVVTTIFPAYDFARQVLGDAADITMLLKPGMESHSYDPSARDIVKIDECDLFICNGGESDTWTEEILSSTENVNVFRMMECVTLLDEEDHNHEHEDSEEHEYDEHIWTSPKNTVDIIEKLAEKASDISPENSELFSENSKAYIEKINDLDKRFSELLKDENRTFVFGDRFPLLYFFKEYNLNYQAAFPGCGSETEPSAQTVASLTDKLKENNTVKTVFYIELSNHKTADILSEETGLDTAEFHTCHNISSDDFNSGETYLSLMERNYNTLKSVLKQGN